MTRTLTPASINLAAAITEASSRPSIAKAAGDFAARYMQYFQGGNPRLTPLTATRFLECFSEVFMAQLMMEQAILAREKLEQVDADSSDGFFYRGKIETAKYFCRNMLPNVFARHTALKQEDTSALDIPEEAF